jgi:hypothetical protein
METTACEYGCRLQIVMVRSCSSLGKSHPLPIILVLWYHHQPVERKGKENLEQDSEKLYFILQTVIM